VIIGLLCISISIDLLGIAILTSSLFRVEDRRQLLVNGYNEASTQNGRQYLSLKLNSRDTHAHVIDS
jgi:hypothetical protein